MTKIIRKRSWFELSRDIPMGAWTRIDRTPNTTISPLRALRFNLFPSYNMPPCEAPMPFSIRLHQRFPVHCAVTYHAGLFQGQGTVWNFSLSGWKLSSDVPPQVGQTCSLTVNLPIEENIVVAAAIVRWVRGQEFGLETMAIDKQTHSRVEHVITRLVNESGENIQ